VAAADEAHPEPVPPPNPQVLHRFHPVTPKPEAKPSVTTPTATSTDALRFSQTATSASASATTVSAVTAATAAVKKVEANVGTFEALKRYQDFLSRNVGYGKKLQSLFDQFDLNHDKKIDLATELPALIQTGVIVKPHANVIASWDLNADKAIDQQEFIMGPLYVSLLQYHPEKQAEYANHLKKANKINMPKNVDFIKTGHLKELAPEDPNWYYIRVASLARKVYLRPQIGVGRLRHIYGGKKNYGSANEHHAVAAGKILRDGLKELERIGVLMRYNDKRHTNLAEKITGDSKLFARVISPEGAKQLNDIAREVFEKTIKTK
jgi:ribosomal protein S19E (S16A)